jgi:hypothetical protein
MHVGLLQKVGYLQGGIRLKPINILFTDLQLIVFFT